MSTRGTLRGTRARLAAVAVCTASMTALSGLAGAAAGPAAAAELPAAATGRVFIVQALPGERVDVTIDHRDPTSGMATADIEGPLTLAPGSHDLSVMSANEDWQLMTSVQVVAGHSVDVVLHRPASPMGRPVVTVYRSPLAPVGQDQGRILLAHTATVPPADARFDGAVAFTDIANGEFVEADVPAGEHSAALVPAGHAGPVLLGPLQVDIPAQTLTAVYAIGRPQDDSMDVIVHRLPLKQRGSAAPGAIHTGSAGLVAGVPLAGAVTSADRAAVDSAGSGAVLIWSGCALVASVLLGAALLAERRRSHPAGVA